MEGIDKNTFKRIFCDHWDAVKQLRPRFDNPDYNETVNKMLGCGDPDKMGFVQYRCCYCGEIRRIAFTCKSCFCLSCAKVYTDRWADFVAFLQEGEVPPGGKGLAQYLAKYVVSLPFL